ncbi:hypothetical protein [Nocardia carnea]|uniref:hypothetical protein n=1 Tax=Nocardia carnea TaxID=37328 RepID=UPI002457C665|nr:hypothetical protein [Nocardia carnea]
MVTGAGSVLIVSETEDLHAAALQAVLRDRYAINPLRLDLRDFPGEPGSFRLGDSGPRRELAGRTGLDEVRAVWWRRPHPSRVPAGARADDDAYRQAECDAFTQGLLWSLPARWVNDPGRDRIAHRKIVQLTAARRAGCAVPETLITNDPGRAREFIEHCAGPVVFKRTGTSRAEFAETRLVELADLDRLGAIRWAPTIFQRYIDPACDLRVVWVGGREWAVRIDSRSGAGRVDSRLDVSVDFAPTRLPPPVSAALAALMDALGLVFGVLDLRVGLDGEHYFLEVNPQGQFAYLEIKTGLPIFASLAGLLVDGDGAVSGW